jgi:hypothetical protein
MAERVRIGTVQNMSLGLMYQNLFLQAGIPVRAEDTGHVYAPGPADLWLEDPSLLDDPDVAKMIDQAFKRPPDQELPLSAMPPVELEQPPSAAWPPFWMAAAILMAFLVPALIAVAVWLAWKAVP